MRNEFILAVLKAARYDMEHRATKAAVMEVIKRGVRKCVSEPDRVAINAMQDRIAEAMESSRLKAPMLAQIETEIWAIEQAIFEHEEALIVSTSSEDVQTTEALTDNEEVTMSNTITINTFTPAHTILKNCLIHSFDSSCSPLLTLKYTYNAFMIALTECLTEEDDEVAKSIFHAAINHSNLECAQSLINNNINAYYNAGSVSVPETVPGLFKLVHSQFYNLVEHFPDMVVRELLPTYTALELVEEA